VAQFVENLNRSLIPRWRPFAVTATVGELGPGGRIRVHDGNALLGIPFLDISGRVTCCGEQGMLDVAFHPGYGLNGQFYVSYSDRNGDTIIARYQVSIDPNVADRESEQQILKIEQPSTSHQAGQLEFGTDGYLYIAVGDGGPVRDPDGRGQELSSLLGKILRIDVDGEAPYEIPEDNPFVDVPEARGEIWVYGLRNPWRFSFDRMTDDLFIGDVGQDHREEINFQPGDSAGGENFGWRLMEGSLGLESATGVPVDPPVPPEMCNDGSLVIPAWSTRIARRIVAGRSPAAMCIAGYSHRRLRASISTGISVPGRSGRRSALTGTRGRSWTRLKAACRSQASVKMSRVSCI
jgi:glucose/arabinose dehydrogenase